MNRIKEVLELKGISQIDFANMLKVSKTTANNISQNKVQPSIKRLYEIADILDVSVHDLIISNNKKSIFESTVEEGNNSEQKTNLSEVLNKLDDLSTKEDIQELKTMIGDLSVKS